jgi:hypothetical protein
MNIFKYINIYVFLISFFLGLFATYIFTPDNKTVVVYPTHENAHLLQLRDKAGNCYSIQERNVVCPKQEELSTIPPQM